MAYTLGGSDFCLAVYGGYTGCAAYPGAGSNSDVATTMVGADGDSLMLDHRVSAFDGIYPGGTTRLMTYYGPLFAGTPAHAPTILSGAKATGVRATTLAAGTYQGWQNLVAANPSWKILSYNYDGGDEPSGGGWSTVMSSAAAAHALSPPMAYLSTTDLVSAKAHNA